MRSTAEKKRSDYNTKQVFKWPVKTSIAPEMGHNIAVSLSA